MGKFILDSALRAAVILCLELAGIMLGRYKDNFLFWVFFLVGVVAFAFFGLRI